MKPDLAKKDAAEVLAVAAAVVINPRASFQGRMPSETGQSKVDTILNEEVFKGLKAIVDALASNPEGKTKAILEAASFEDLILRFGYRVDLTPQIHVQDCYEKMGPHGPIRAVVQYHDTVAHNSYPTVIHKDGAVTTTPKAAAFFSQMLRQLKQKLPTT